MIPIWTVSVYTYLARVPVTFFTSPDQNHQIHLALLAISLCNKLNMYDTSAVPLGGGFNAELSTGNSVQHDPECLRLPWTCRVPIFLWLQQAALQQQQQQQKGTFLNTAAVHL